MKDLLVELEQDVTNIKQVARVQALYEAIRNTQAAVSYTHLTLPTSDLV